jgi:hypothetical protein
MLFATDQKKVIIISGLWHKLCFGKATPAGESEKNSCKANEFLYLTYSLLVSPIER